MPGIPEELRVCFKTGLIRMLWSDGLITQDQRDELLRMQGPLRPDR